MDARIKIRQAIRLQRNNLKSELQQCAAQALATIVTALPIFQQSQHIAVYMAHYAEIDPALIVEIALQQGKTIYLPCLKKTPSPHLIFQRYIPDEPLTVNQYGIPEPKPEPTHVIAPQQLDLVLTPLVAFDTLGMRLGTGGGYYDRTFAFKLQASNPPPYLLGLAYEFQKVEKIEPAEWDIVLDGIATDKNFYPIKKV